MSVENLDAYQVPSFEEWFEARYFQAFYDRYCHGGMTLSREKVAEIFGVDPSEMNDELLASIKNIFTLHERYLPVLYKQFTDQLDIDIRAEE